MPPRKRCPTGWSKDIDGKCYPKPGTDITKRPDIALAHGFTSVTNYAMGGPRRGVTTNFAPQRPTYTPKNPPPKPRSYNPFAALGPLTPHYHANDWNADTGSFQDAKNMWSNKPHLVRGADGKWVASTGGYVLGKYALPPLETIQQWDKEFKAARPPAYRIKKRKA